MTDAILLARVEALMQNLKRVHDASPWFEKSVLEKEDENGDYLWAGMTDEDVEYMWLGLAPMETKIKQQLRSLDRLRDMLQEADTGKDEPTLTPEQAWQQYAGIHEESEGIFQECLEFLGGLAFRDRGLDARVCQHALCRVADELIRRCAKESTGNRWDWFSVPASREALSRTLVRTVRLRFPDWTIWSLPITAHEYGHVVMYDKREFQEFLNAEAGRLAATEATCLRRAQNHLNELFADAFATYMMGPAYPCALIRLRLDPSSAFLDDADHPADAKRAGTVLRMLRRMNDEAKTSTSDPYGSIIGKLEGEWSEVLQRAAPGGALGTAWQDYLEHLIGVIWDLFSDHLYRSAKYPHAGTDGWAIAQMWAKDWSDGLTLNGSPVMPAITPRSTLRDVLNAAWSCRMSSQSGDADPSLTHIAEIAREMCLAIINQRPRPSGSSGKHASAAPRN